MLLMSFYRLSNYGIGDILKCIEKCSVWEGTLLLPDYNPLDDNHNYHPAQRFVFSLLLL